jgi:hypothetical protein
VVQQTRTLLEGSFLDRCENVRKRPAAPVVTTRHLSVEPFTIARVRSRAGIAATQGGA